MPDLKIKKPESKQSREEDINKIMADLAKRTDEFNKKAMKEHPEWKEDLMTIKKSARDRAKKGGYSKKND